MTLQHITVLLATKDDITLGLPPLVAALLILGVGVVFNFGIFWLMRTGVTSEKKRLSKWLTSKDFQVESVEWVMYPTSRFWLRRCTTYEARFTDKSGTHHHAFIAIPTWGNPEFVEDKTTPA